MPKVGGRDFSYSKEGMEAAKKYAEEIGQEVEMPMSNAMERSETYAMGGLVDEYKKGGKV